MLFLSLYCVNIGNTTVLWACVYDNIRGKVGCQHTKFYFLYYYNIKYIFLLKHLIMFIKSLLKHFIFFKHNFFFYNFSFQFIFVVQRLKLTHLKKKTALLSFVNKYCFFFIINFIYKID